MTYAEQAAEAKVEARDILRTQMASRIMAKIADAEQDVVAAVKGLANLIVRFAKDDADAAEAQKKAADKRAAFNSTLASLDGITEEERAIAQAAVAKAQAAKDKADAEDAKRMADDRAAEKKNALDGIADARKNLEHHKDNLAKLESGEMKVDADELKKLTAKLLEDGRVVAGEATQASSTEAEG